MTISQLFVNLFCFGLLILGVICLLIGSPELGIYANTLVVAIQSILITQQVIFRNQKDK